MCSVAPNLPSTSSCRPEHSPAHKVSWEGTESREDGLERGREEREEEWGQRAFELERIQRDNSPQGEAASARTGAHVRVTHSLLTSGAPGRDLVVLQLHHRLR